MKYGFVKVAAAIPSVKVADPTYNAKHIINQIKEAAENKASVILFPELCITGYTCADLFQQDFLLESSEKALETIINETAEHDIISILGMPLLFKSAIYNVGVVIRKGEILGIVPKRYLPNYSEFYEQRWFRSGKDIISRKMILCGQKAHFGCNLTFRTKELSFAVELCEDLWAPVPKSADFVQAGAEVIFNLSADNDTMGKYNYVQNLVKVHSSQCICGYVFSSCGFGESTTDTVFGGKCLIYEMGEKLCEAERFRFEPQIIYSEIDIEHIRSARRTNMTFASFMTQENDIKEINIDAEGHEATLTRHINRMPFIPSPEETDKQCNEIFAIQTMGLAKRLDHAGCKNVVVGISGGLDSTLAVLVCAGTFKQLGIPSENITAVTMPGFGTTDRTYNNAMALMKALGVTIREISIKEACINHFNDIGHDINRHDVTYENSQARERTQILMDIANQVNGMVVGTGDMSELALGWATYNGDHMSMYGVNSGIPKTLVQHLVKWIAENHSDSTVKETLIDIVNTPISPELMPHDENGNIKQKTEDLVGPYELHDFFLYNMIKNKFTPEKIQYLAEKAFEGIYDKETIYKWLTTFIRRFFVQQFKRSCLPDGPKVSDVSLSPRSDWKMPSDASFESWLDNINKI